MLLNKVAPMNGGVKKVAETNSSVGARIPQDTRSSRRVTASHSLQCKNQDMCIQTSISSSVYVHYIGTHKEFPYPAKLEMLY